MCVLSDKEIMRLAFQENMITPFADHSVKKNEKGEGILSYGLSSYGYDIRCANRFKIFTNINAVVVDPKNLNDKCFVDFEGDVCIIPPNSFVLTYSVEKIKVPRDVLVEVIGKSTIARTGVICIVTPLEPEWEGHITLEFSNTTSLPVKLYANEGCAQLVFHRGEEDCDVSYADRKGKYQNQAAEIVLPKI